MKCYSEGRYNQHSQQKKAGTPYTVPQLAGIVYSCHVAQVNNEQ